MSRPSPGLPCGIGAPDFRFYEPISLASPQVSALESFVRVELISAQFSGISVSWGSSGRGCDVTAGHQ